MSAEKEKHDARMFIRLPQRELEEFTMHVKSCGMTKTKYLRKLMRGVRPVEFPPKEYVECLEVLQNICDSLQGIQHDAYNTGQADIRAIEDLRVELMKQVEYLNPLRPDFCDENIFDQEAIATSGNHKNMGQQ